MNENPPRAPHKPSWRKPAGIFIMIGMIVLLCWLIGSLSLWVGRWPVWLQIPLYGLAGVSWILPLKPLLLWMETGHWTVSAGD